MIGKPKSLTSLETVDTKQEVDLTIPRDDLVDEVAEELSSLIVSRLSFKDSPASKK